jgi:hypothetical protein
VALGSSPLGDDLVTLDNIHSPRYAEDNATVDLTRLELGIELLVTP